MHEPLQAPKNEYVLWVVSNEHASQLERKMKKNIRKEKDFRFVDKWFLAIWINRIYLSDIDKHLYVFLRLHIVKVVTAIYWR